MGWFEEQLKYRKQIDDEQFSDALDVLAGSVMGDSVRKAMSKEKQVRDAVQEVARYFGMKVRDIEVPAGVKDPEEQLSIMLRPYGLLKKPVVLDKDWYRHASGPMLAVLKESGESVALLPRAFTGYTLFDPATGKRRKMDRETAGRLDKNAICFFEPLPQEGISTRELIGFIIKQLTHADIFLYFLSIGLPVLVGLLSPLFTKWLFGTVVVSGSLEMLLSLAVFMICFLVCRFLLNVFKELIRERIYIRQDIAVRTAVMGRVLHLKPEFFKDYSAGELASRITSLDLLCLTLSQSIGSVGLTSLFSLIYIGQIFAFAPSLSGPALFITVISAFLVIITARVRSRITGQVLYESSKTGGMTYPMITGVQKIRVAGAERRMFARWADQYAKEERLRYDLPLFVKMSPALVTAVTLFGSIILYREALKAGISIDNYYAFISAYGMVNAAFLMLSEMAVPLSNIGPIMKMAEPILEAETESDTEKQVVTGLTGSIELKNVSFRYEEGQPNVVDHLSLKIDLGEYVAIVGRTGCGKSTLLKLLLGFEIPDRGTIYYDRRDMAHLDLRSLRKKIGTVLQDDRLFIGDIYSNIVITAPHLSQDDAWKAAETAQIAEDIRRMPMGMHTMVGEGFGGLSGGQKQRILIARAVASKPKILFFDEATSALDNSTQEKISRAIDEMKCTRVVIAHRLSTIRNCDRILVLKDGKIAEEGKYEELINAGGEFSELVKRQRLDMADHCE